MKAKVFIGRLFVPGAPFSTSTLLHQSLALPRQNRVGGRRSWLGYTCVATLVDSVRVGHGADLAGVGGGGDSIDTALMLEASDVSAAEYACGADGAT
mgnify:CR=1 FL=1